MAKKPKEIETVRRELLALLEGGNAHLAFDDAIAGFPPEHMNAKPTRLPYSFWHLLEHMRIVQWDILEFVRNPNHVSPPYPDGYWPREDEEADKKAWEKTVRAYRADLKALGDMVTRPEADFYGPIPHAPGYSLFREILLAADHNAYHVGELVILRRIMGYPAEE